MSKLLRYYSALFLAVVMVAGSAVSAFTGSLDSGSGVQYQKQTQSSTANIGADAQSDANTAGQNTGSQSTGAQIAAGEDGEAYNTEATADVVEEAAAAAAEAAAQANSPMNVPKRLSHLQTTVLLQNGRRSRTSVNDKQIYSEGMTLVSIPIFLTEIIGSVHYRAYTPAGGWTPWAMNGQQTIVMTLEDFQWASVEAVQTRLSGPVHSDYDVYYAITLNNGKKTDWTMDGRTAGTMNQGLVLTGLRMSCFAKRGAFPYRTANPVISAYADGIQNVDGVLCYIHGDSFSFTRWGWDDVDRYHFVDSNPVTGWQYLDEYKYYSAGDGKSVQDLEPIIGAKGPYQIKTNKGMNCMTVYVGDGGNGFIISLKAFLVSTGDDTPPGTFPTPEKYCWCLTNSGVYVQHAICLGKGLPFLMHSIAYDRLDIYTAWASTHNHIGVARSAGCIRLLSRNVRQAYDNCPVETAAVVYNDYTLGPYEHPVIAAEIPFAQNWDPIDANATPGGITVATATIMAQAQ